MEGLDEHQVGHLFLGSIFHQFFPSRFFILFVAVVVAAVIAVVIATGRHFDNLPTFGREKGCKYIVFPVPWSGKENDDVGFSGRGWGRMMGRDVNFD